LECIVCQNTLSTAYSNQVWHIWDVQYSLVRCNNCASIFTNPLPSDEVLAKVYAESFDYRWYQDHYTAKYRDCQSRIVEYRQLIGKRVLDFGGGVGYMSAALRSAGYESITYDPFCRESDKVESGWDAVIALHVLEHANNPDRTIMQMKSLLAADGRLILAVPNAGGEGYRKLGMHWVWAQPPLLHIVHFTVVGLRSLLERNGFIVEEVHYAERWDANRYCDLEQVEQFKKLDSLWGRQPYNRYGLYRKACAAYVSAKRYKGLQKALFARSQHSEDFSELQIVARLAVSR